MSAIDGYRCGINFGGWFEFYPHSMDLETCDIWMTEEDVKAVASWGMDHIRLPFNSELIYDAENNEFIEEGFKRIDRVLSWCEKYGLNLVMDLHRTPGYAFINAENDVPNPFLDDPYYQEIFYEIWRTFARRYIEHRDNVAFELLNEVVEEPASRWNRIAAKGIQAIREIDPERIIIYGGIHFNSVYNLKDLEVSDDPKIVYNFHFYNPHLFTHQHASWSKAPTLYNKDVRYPGYLPELKEFLTEYPEFSDNSERYLDREMNSEMMREEFRPVIEFKNAHPDAPLYCGEFGIITYADAESRKNWFNDIIGLFNELQIARAVFTYRDGKGGAFALMKDGIQVPIFPGEPEILSKK